MSSDLVESPKSKESGRAKRSPNRFYVFTVVGLAVFLVGMAIWRPPVASQTVQSRVLYKIEVASVAGDASADAPAGNATNGSVGLVDPIRADNNLLDAAKRVGLSEAKAGAGSPAANTNITIKHLRQHVDVNTGTGENPGETIITIAYTGGDEQTALDFVDELAARFVSEVAAVEKQKQNVPLIHEQQGRASEELGKLRRDMDETKKKLDHFVKQRLQEIKELASDDGEDGNRKKAEKETNAVRRSTAEFAQAAVELGDPVNGSQNAAPASNGPRRNPRWTTLNHQIAILEAERERLLAHRTLSHPLVLDTQASIERMKRLASITPEFLQNSPDSASVKEHPSRPPESQQPEARDTADTSPPSRPRANRVAMLAEIRLSDDYLEKRRKYLAAREAFQSAAKRVETSKSNEPAPIPAARSAIIIEDARVLRRDGGTPSVARVFILGLVSAVVGLVCISLGIRGRVTGPLTSIEDVEATLQLRVFGTIATTDGPNIRHNKPNSSRIVRWVTHSCELTLALITILLIFMALTDRLFAAHLLEDLFSAYSYAIYRVTASIT